MSSTSASPAGGVDPTPTERVHDPKKARRALWGAYMGTSLEWYDFFLYASAAGLVFNHLFFEPMGPQAATLVAFATVGLSFLFRPLGAFLAGHFGDKYGRKVILMITLITMGVATALIGVLPTFETAGIVAPILLAVLRFVQGMAAGGEWGGATLLAVENAPEHKRGFYGAVVQLGSPTGTILSSMIVAAVVAEYDVRSARAGLPRVQDLEAARKTVLDLVAGYGPLQPFLDDPEVEEIWINGPA